MVIIISILLFTVFLFLSFLHVYWAFGGRWGDKCVIPTKDNDVKPKMPGPVPTLIVALGLLTIGTFILSKSGLFNLHLPLWIDRYGLGIIMTLFTLRAIGDFRYVGFFKKIKHTDFAKNDTKYYSPLCLIIGIMVAVIALV